MRTLIRATLFSESLPHQKYKPTQATDSSDFGLINASQSKLASQSKRESVVPLEFGSCDQPGVSSSYSLMQLPTKSTNRPFPLENHVSLSQIPPPKRRQKSSLPLDRQAAPRCRSIRAHALYPTVVWHRGSNIGERNLNQTRKHARRTA